MTLKKYFYVLTHTAQQKKTRYSAIYRKHVELRRNEGHEEITKEVLSPITIYIYTTSQHQLLGGDPPGMIPSPG